MSHCLNTFRLLTIQQCTLTPAVIQHTLPLAPFSPRSTVKAGVIRKPHDIPQRACRLYHSFTARLCGMGYKKRGKEEEYEEEQEGDRLLTAEQVGMQLLPSRYTKG